MKVTPMKVVWTIVTLILGAAALVTVKPSVFARSAELALSVPGAQLIALRGWIICVFVVAALFLMIVALIRRVTIHRGGFAFLMGLILLVAAALHGVTLYSRGLSNPGSLGPDTGVSASGAGDGSITVLQYNTLGGKTTAIEIVELIEANGVDVVTLPETSSSMGQEIVQELANRGKTFTQFDTGTSGYDADYESTVLLVSSSLGSYTSATVFDDLTGKPSAVRAVSSDGSGPDLIAIHPVAPSTDSLENWKEQITATYQLCSTYPNAIISGDFNSTADHQAAAGFGDSCTDAAVQAGSGGIGTWSTSVPSFFGSPIDRVLTPADYSGTDAAIVQVGESDHRGVLVRLSPVQ